MLTAELYSDGQLVQSWDVINEAVICRGKDVRPIQVRVDLREGYMNSYMADGVIVSTATGSTAYALASGGPVLPPELRNMLILPIAPPISALTVLWYLLKAPKSIFIPPPDLTLCSVLTAWNLSHLKTAIVFTSVLISSPCTCCVLVNQTTFIGTWLR